MSLRGVDCLNDSLNKPTSELLSDVLKNQL